MAFASLTRPGYHLSRFGPGRVLTIGAAPATNNSAALRVGRYMLRVTVESVRVRGALAETEVAVATDMLFEAGDIFYADVGTEAGEQFISMLRAGAADATVIVCGVDGDAVNAQPPTWT